MKFFVYGLFDPLQASVIRYIGAASKIERPRQHAIEAARGGNSHKLNWIRSLGERGYDWRILQECNSRDNTMKAERAWIAEMRIYIGRKLTNVTGGGDGFISLTEEANTRRIAGIKKAWDGPSAIAKKALASERRRARNATPEHRASLSAALRGKPKSPEHCAKMSAARRGKGLSEETKRKLSEANRGRRPPSRLGFKSSEETKRRQSEAWTNNPERREKFSEAVRTSWQVAREERTSGMRAAWSVPETHERRRAAIAAGTRAYWERKRASL